MALKRIPVQYMQKERASIGPKWSPPLKKPQDNVFRQTSVRVAVLGADTRTGQALSLLLKQNVLVSQLFMQGGESVVGLAKDLSHIDTRCGVRGFCGTEETSKAVRSADIVLMIGLDNVRPDTLPEDRFHSEADRLLKLTSVCSKYAPKALITVSVTPVSFTLPFVTALFKKTHWYHPGRVIGSVALCQVRANSLTARFLDLDPTSVHVPLLGGPDIDCVVPVFSRASPVSLMMEEARLLSNRIRRIADDTSPLKTPVPCRLGDSPLSEAFAINRMVTTMALGLCGDSGAVCSAFVRSNLIETCDYLVATVKFGPGGVVHNFGLPVMTPLELKLFEKVSIVLDEREDKALEFLEILETRGKPLDFLAKQHLARRHGRFVKITQKD